MAIVFEKEHGIYVYGADNSIIIIENPDCVDEQIVLLSVRQFEEIVKRHKEIIKEALEEKD